MFLDRELRQLAGLLFAVHVVGMHFINYLPDFQISQVFCSLNCANLS